MADETKDSPGFKVTDRRGQPKEESRKPEPQPPPREEKKSTARKEPLTVDFPNFILSLSTSALAHMGLVEGPDGKTAPPNVDAARQEIDILEMLKEKTKGNLTAQEAGLLNEVLYELRVRFVETARGLKRT